MVSSEGRIKRIQRRINSSFGATRLLNERISQHNPKNKNGYKRINLTVNGVMTGFLVHRLVAEVFVKNPRNLPHVNHIDGEKLNNHPSNLEWVTHKENIHHAYKTGLIKCEKSVCSNLDGFGYWYPSIAQASRHTGASRPCICAAAMKKRQITAGGMAWEYAQK